jgi:hypothetical protein
MEKKKALKPQGRKLKKKTFSYDNEGGAYKRDSQEAKEEHNVDEGLKDFVSKIGGKVAKGTAKVWSNATTPVPSNINQPGYDKKTYWKNREEEGQKNIAANKAAKEARNKNEK